MASQQGKEDISKAVMYIGGIVLAVLVGYLLFKIIWQLFSFIIFALGILLAILNWGALVSVYNKIADIYKQNLLMGIMATLLAFLAAPFVIIYLSATTLMGYLEKKDKTKNRRTEEDDDYTPFEEI